MKDNIVTLSRDGNETKFVIPEGQDPLHVIKRQFQTVNPVPLEGLPRFVGGAVGFMSYDIVRYFERLPETASDDLGVPTMAFMLPDTLVIFDHAKHQLIVLANAHKTDDTTPDLAYDKAIQSIDQIVVALGNRYHSNPMRQYPMKTLATRNRMSSNMSLRIASAKPKNISAMAMPSRLSRHNALAVRRLQHPCRFIVRYGRPIHHPICSLLQFNEDLTLVGASPEMLVRLEDGVAYNRPLAGTRKRGANEKEDLALEEDLLSDPKERAEHVMLVDLGRNDLGRVCDYGTVKVPQMMYVERYSHVMHIVSQVEGKLRKVWMPLIYSVRPSPQVH